MKIRPTLKTLQGRGRKGGKASPSSSSRLPGERHTFRELNLVPPQHLAPDGTITSSREHEVSSGSDPLMLRIRELEAEVATLEAELHNLRNPT